MNDEVRKILHEMRTVLSNLTVFTVVGRRIVAAEGKVDADEVNDLAESCDLLDRSAVRAADLVKRLEDVWQQG